MAQPVWDDARAAWWLATAAQREQHFAPLTEALFARAALQPGERVLDVGVGSGPTTARAWEAVRPDGSVTGIDVVPAMIASARELVPDPEIEWVVGDAAAYEFTPDSYDVIISRLGLMFFTDPVAALEHLRSAVRPGGRLTAILWANLDSAPVFSLPYVVATTTLDRLGVDYEQFPTDGILFSLGAPGVAGRTLTAAGWDEVDVRVDLSELSLGPDPAAATKMAMVSRPIELALEGQPEAVRAEVDQALLSHFERRRTDTGITLPGGFLVASARRAA